MKRRVLLVLFVRIPIWILVFSVALVLLLKWVPVRYTPLMLKRSIQFRNDEEYHAEQRWVPLENMAPELIRAVIAAEDQKYYHHRGFDWKELGTMWYLHRHEGTPLRGCSTISQQTAKNVFTFGSHTIFRKANEAYWTYLIELIWGKRRILEVYLNVIETGKGLYGVEAASEFYYGESASNLGIGRAVCLVACLPTPLCSSPDNPSVGDRVRRNKVLKRMGL